MNSNFYVYVLFRPWDCSPCYVGKGKGRRYREHNWKGVSHYNPRLARIFERVGGPLPVVLLHIGLDETTAFEYEKKLIAAIGRGRKGPLVNLTDGGEGTVGFKNPWSDEKRAKIIARWTPERKAEASKYWKDRGHTFPEGAAAKGGATWKGKTRASKGKPLSPSHRAAISAANMGRSFPHEGVPRSPETRAKISASLQARKLASLARLTEDTNYVS